VAYVYEREQGTLPRLQSLPIPERSIIVAKAVASFVLGVGSTAVLLVAGSVFFGVDFGDPLPTAVLVVALVAAVTSLVLLVIRVARTAEQAQVANTIIGLVMGVLGGSFFPVAGSGWLTTLSDLTPPAAFIRGLGIVSGGGDVADLGAPLTILFGFMALAAAIGLVMPDRVEP
jgi:ABC-2 type transport system permease protein